MKHYHYWSYPHRTIEGRKPNEFAIIRYCFECKLKQVAFTSNWKQAKGDYALREHYKIEGEK